MISLYDKNHENYEMYLAVGAYSKSMSNPSTNASFWSILKGLKLNEEDAVVGHYIDGAEL